MISARDFKCWIPANGETVADAIVFTRAEVQAIREYSNRLEPADSHTPSQDGAQGTTPKGGA